MEPTDNETSVSVRDTVL